MLRAWEDAPAFLLSCPGPLRRHTAAVAPISQFLPTQCLLGYEAQLLAFVAAVPELADRLYFTPLPEIFAAPESYAGQLAQLLPQAGPRAVHLRFGGTRTARVLKEARNGVVLAEDHRALPVTTSRHPFASGLVLPAAVRRVFTYAPHQALPHRAGGGELGVTMLSATCVTADLETSSGAAPDATPAADGEETGSIPGLDVVSLAEFRSAAWAAGTVRPHSAHLQAALQEQAEDGAPFVLVPWNLDHPGSTVPALLGRLAKLQDPALPAVRLLVLPFNYPGQTGLIRRAIRRIREAAHHPDATLSAVFLARLTRHAALPALHALGAVAWIDGNDPEHRWTMRRLGGAGFTTILLEPPEEERPGSVAQGVRLPAAEVLVVEAETRYGTLSYASHLPSVQALPELLAMTRQLAPPEFGAPPQITPTPPRRRGRPAPAIAAV